MLKKKKKQGFPTLKPPGGAASQVVLRDPNAIEKRGSKGGNSLDFWAVGAAFP